MQIDLRIFYEPLVADIKQSLEKFIAKSPDQQICTVGLWGDGFHGTASLHLDTVEHSAAHIKEGLDRGLNWYGEDAQGRYCNNCWDFAHCIGEYLFPDYPNLYELPSDEEDEDSEDDEADEEEDDFEIVVKKTADGYETYMVPKGGRVLIEFISLNGETEQYKSHEGDEGLHRIVFPFLKSVMESIDEFNLLNQAQPFRIGVQMRESVRETFWLSKGS